MSSPSARMYSQTSSSVQLEIGKTLTCSPRRTRPLYRLHSSARWRRGSHWPKSSRKEKMRSLALARSSSRRAPPNAAPKPCSAMASTRVTVRSRLRDEGVEQGPRLQPVAGRARAGLLAHAALVDGLLDGGHDQPLAQLGHPPV